MSRKQTEAELLEEISRLTGAINAKKTTATTTRSNIYTNPNYRPAYRPPYAQVSRPGPSRPPYTQVSTQAPRRDVVLDGVTFETDPTGRRLIRKGVAVPVKVDPKPKPIGAQPLSQANMIRTRGGLVASHRLGQYKPAPPPPNVLAAKKARLAKYSLILNGVQSARYVPGDERTKQHTELPHYFILRTRTKKPRVPQIKKVDKPCRFFTRTGLCTRGLTCPYQHDPTKTAICPRFLAGNCPDADSCALSHDPTPERVPLCVHFAKSGYCKNGENCVYPHVNVGIKHGVCRDFAVLGYCGKGLECEKQHVKECPDFADTGACPTKGCKLPHVIRAKHNRTPVQKGDSPIRSAPVTNADQVQATSASVASESKASGEEEFISLTFHESSEDEEEEDNDEEGEEDDEEDDESMLSDREESPDDDAIVDDIL